MSGEEFRERDLRGARFVESDLSDVVIRGCDISGMEIDAPWLTEGKPLTVNGVDVVAYVEGELVRRFPGRELRGAESPDELRTAWAASEAAWEAAIDRAGAMPAGTVDVSVGGEWSFAQTIRHLVHATDLWFGRSVLGVADAMHPLGIGYNQTVTDTPPFAEVLAARADRVARVRDFLATVTDEQLDEPRPNPHNPDHPETVRQCLRVVLEESWEHLRFAVRDLDLIDSGAHLP
jgi:uncharacterized damage-inducible protein DinB